MCDNNIKPTGKRKRRDIEGSDELTHEDFEVLMTPLKSNEHHREKRSVVSKDNATRYCAERLLETRVGKLCAKLGTNVQALVNVCSADIEYTGDFSFAIGAVSMLMNECEDVVIENITVNSNETNVTKPTIPSALEKVVQLLCPNDCTFNGKCVNRSCICKKDYTAADCSISIYQRPTITRIQSNGLCDRRKRPCEKITVQGRDFLNSTNITCHIREIEIVNSSWIPNKNETKYQGTMTDLVLVECLLPSLPVLRMRYHETIEGIPAAGLMISVSNNGIDKSSQELKMISFDSVCMDCNVSAGCTVKVV
ncbi:PREDICTED: von Willebrand factor D and EGF domain-containing protein-like [Acropora digitifera]|uniref:von Willebrand factor D and EGF domain-containing protein-like n=1 Tax=Acropora digitifera TaxID=70779 RepID=UPI00077B2403|nr:PREDICTED: von Willebrand factor D and EGF domain-containing protein-like [Acropora digitifera]